MPASGTIELLAAALAHALAPLERRLSPEEVDGFFARLGLQFPSSVTAHPGLKNALQGASGAAGQLALVAASLSSALNAGDLPAILTQGASTLGKLGEMFGKLDSIGSELGALANSFPGIPPGEVLSFAASLPRAIMELAIVEHLERVGLGVTNGLAITGIIDRHTEPGAAADPAKVPFEVKRLKLGRLAELLQAPTAYAQNLYGWGGPGFDGRFLFEQLVELAGHSGLPALLIPPAAPGGFSSLDLLFVEVQVDSAVHPPGLRIDLRVPIKDGFDVDLPLSRPGWRLEMANDARIDAGSVARVFAPASITLTPPAGSLTGGLRVQVSGKPAAPDTHMLIVGVAGGMRLEAASITVKANADLQWDGGAGLARTEPALEAAIEGGRFVLSLDQGGDLLTALIPKDLVHAELDLAIGWAHDRFFLRGSSNLQATFPVHASIGPVDIQSVTVGLAPGAGTLPIEVSATVQTALGPLSLLIERIGLTAAFDFPGGASGNLGPLNVGLGFKLPTGIGLALDAGPVSGGGYLSLDPSGQRYGGVLQLKLPIANVVAFGIYEQVQGRASFVAVLGIRFNPGVQLSFGFALTGVGGLVGLNRRANVDMLRERLASGAAGNVLFCEDPVKNAPTILGDLAAFFPAASNGFLVGPTLQISWLSPIVRLDIGILIEFPGPSKIIILGSIRAMLGLNETLALLHLRMDVLGIIDFEQQLISIDAALVNSHALGIVRLTGGMAFRLSYGNNPYILMSVGGFHPRFDPGPLNIPRLARIGASLDVSVVVHIYVRVELYVAFTSNTLQAGSRVEAGMDIGPLSVHGYFAFDALIQFRPFYFDLEYSAGFDVEVFGTSFCSVAIVGRISGPGPVVIYASGSVKLLFVRVSASATFELGESNGDTLTSIASPVHELAPELRQMTNLRTEGDDPTIVRRPGRPAVQGVLVSPKGSLIWEQKRAPLKTIIHRLGGVPLAGQHQLHLDAPVGWTTSDEQDWFNPGSFTNFDLKASQTLNNATFQELASGLRIGNAVDAQAKVVVEYTDEIDLVKRPAMTRFGIKVGAYLTTTLHAMLRERTTTPAVDPGPPKVVVNAETADVHAPDGVLLHAQQTPFQAFQLARQDAGRIAVPTTDVRVDL